MPSPVFAAALASSEGWSCGVLTPMFERTSYASASWCIVDSCMARVGAQAIPPGLPVHRSAELERARREGESREGEGGRVREREREGERGSEGERE